MGLRIYGFFILITLVTVVAPMTRAQENQDEGISVRGAFLTTRPSSSDSPNKSSGNATGATNNRTRPTKAGSDASTKKGTSAGATSASGPRKEQETTVAVNSKKKTSIGSSSSKANSNANYEPAYYKSNAIGLGYTLYTMDATGDTVRADPDKEYRNGDRIRIALESNTDGYLYVFHTEGDGEPEMLFPDARLNRGDNAISAHVPYEIPSNTIGDERYRWFIFDAKPATERLYIVISRHPLPNVLTGELLVDYCSISKDQCPWHPTPATWAQINKTDANTQVAVSKIKDYGRSMTSGEREATTRGLKLSQDVPAPSIVRMNSSASEDMLVATINLIHK